MLEDGYLDNSGLKVIWVCWVSAMVGLIAIAAVEMGLEEVTWLGLVGFVSGCSWVYGFKWVVGFLVVAIGGGYWWCNIAMVVHGLA